MKLITIKKMQDRDDIHQILKNIDVEVLKQKSDMSLLGGNAGAVLFNVLYAKHFKNNELSDEINANIQSLVDNSLNIGLFSLSGGLAGVNWFFNYLYVSGYIDIEDRDELCSGDGDLSKIALELLQHGNYDFLHGAIGIAYYLLDANKEDEGFFYKFFSALNPLAENETGMFYHFDFETYSADPTKINLGLAHGLSSILKFALQCYELGTCKEPSSQLVQRITRYLINNINVDKQISCYASFVDLLGNSNTTSRLAWCYGDLSIAYTLYKSGIVMGNLDTVNFSLKIFKHTINRIGSGNTMVKDAGICHGSAGIAHIYNKMWHYTGAEEFRESCDYWIKETIKYAKYSDTISGYKRFNAVKEEYNQQCGILEGTAGIGLVLISYLTSDFSWDYPLMLN